MSASPAPPPPIPKDHPLRAFYEQQRRGLQIQLAAIDRALGYGGTARERRERERAECGAVQLDSNRSQPI